MASTKIFKISHLLDEVSVLLLQSVYPDSELVHAELILLLPRQLLLPQLLPLSLTHVFLIHLVRQRLSYLNITVHLRHSLRHVFVINGLMFGLERISGRI